MQAAALGRLCGLRPLSARRPACQVPIKRRKGSVRPSCQAPGEGAGAAFPSDSGSSSGPLDAFTQQPGSSSGKEGGSSDKEGSGGGDRLLAPVREALQAYDRAVKRRPVLTKALTSFAGFALGDRIAQGVAGGAAYDPYRAARLSLYGLLIDGPVGHAWYKLLDKHVCPDAPTSNKAVLIKTALDQLVWGPAMTLVFFAFLKTLEGHPELIWATIQTKFVPTMLANYVLWPLAHLINFKYVPTDWRIAFNNAVALLWTTYLSFLCGGPAAGGAAAHGPGVDATAAAASALLSAFPCSKLPGALQHAEVADAARQVAAMEQVLASWGAKAFSSAEQLGAYLQMKAEVVQHICKPPIRLP